MNVHCSSGAIWLQRNGPDRGSDVGGAAYNAFQDAVWSGHAEGALIEDESEHPGPVASSPAHPVTLRLESRHREQPLHQPSVDAILHEPLRHDGTHVGHGPKGIGGGGALTSGDHVEAEVVLAVHGHARQIRRVTVGNRHLDLVSATID